MNKREQWLDVAKGLGIIAVVMGHAPNNPTLSHYLFWFHMPLFFALSGYLHKQLETPPQIADWTKKRTFQLLVPYITFACLITVVIYSHQILERKFILVDAVKNILGLAYGGKYMVGPYAVFWFITCLLATQILFTLITYKFKSASIQISILIVLFIIAHVQTTFTKIDRIPWNIDVALIAIFYYAFGYYFKRFKDIILKNIFIICLVFISSLSFIILDSSGIIQYTLDMKNHLYTNLIFDIIIPICFILSVFILSNLIAKINFIGEIGKMSLTIMYLHFPLNFLVKYLFGWYNFYSFVIIGLIIPIAIHLIIKRYKLTNLLFQGISIKKQRQVNLEIKGLAK
ncbi:acyltransferase family protein [Bacillus sp. 03113]|uniref:acyltransferase family protein n=1 Tax=Bacillus sp. 03113 TaxID=2578211 RepID=UPI00114471FB|nr:acyltransferase family protein [Bacillus sp. 03113]